MGFPACDFDGKFDRRAIFANGSKGPLQQIVLAVDLALDQFLEARPSSFVPQDDTPKYETERQIVDQCFEGGRSACLRKVGVHPAPIRAVTIAAIMTLDAEAQGLLGELFPIELDFTAEGSVGMRRARKADPAFVAQHGAEIGMNRELPRNRMTVHDDVAPARFLLDAAVGNVAAKGKLFARAPAQTFDGKTLNEALGRAVFREPGGPNLRGHFDGCEAEARNARIQDQIAKPPSAAAVGQATAQKPDFIAPLHRKRGIHRVQLALIQEESLRFGDQWLGTILPEERRRYGNDQEPRAVPGAGCWIGQIELVRDPDAGDRIRARKSGYCQFP